MLKDLTLNPLVASAGVLDSLGAIDEMNAAVWHQSLRLRTVLFLSDDHCAILLGYH